jgi:hypothetical protein
MADGVEIFSTVSIPTLLRLASEGTVALHPKTKPPLRSAEAAG